MSGFLEDGVNAYLIPPNDVPALSEAIRHVLLSHEEAAAVGRRGRELALERFDYRVVGAMMAEFISEHMPAEHGWCRRLIGAVAAFRPPVGRAPPLPSPPASPW